MIIRRTDSEGRDVTDLPGLWSESDTTQVRPETLADLVGYLEEHSRVRITLAGHEPREALFTPREALFRLRDSGLWFVTRTCPMFIACGDGQPITFDAAGCTIRDYRIDYLEDLRP